MGITERIKREVFIRPWLKQGYSRKIANAYYRKVLSDNKKNNGVSAAEKKWAHDHKYFSDSIRKYDLKNNPDKYISDLDYMFLRPFNNSFTKWIKDLVTTNHVLTDYSEYLPKLYYHIMDREGKKLFLPIDTVNREYGESYEDFLELLKERKRLILRPSIHSVKRSAYVIECVGEDRYELSEDKISREAMEIFGGKYDRFGLLEKDKKWREPKRSGRISRHKRETYDKESLYTLISALEYDYVIAEPYKLSNGFEGMIKLYMANIDMERTEMLDAYVIDSENKKIQYTPVALEDGKIGNSDIKVPHWADIVDGVTKVSKFMSEIEYFCVYVIITDDGFAIDFFGDNPVLPKVAHSDKLNEYLLERLAVKKASFKVTRERWMADFKRKRFDRWVKKHCRPGIRPYMQSLWMHAVKDDLLHNKGTTLKEKLWCYKRGFMSYRIKQYGLTEDNYKNFLSDYQYHWLNRINNSYQVWINDKTTTRYIMEPCKQYLAKYYYDIIKMHGKTCIKALQDIPEGFGASFEEIFRLLRQEKLLALKPSSGTHGDGFYRLEYTDEGIYLVNGKEMSEEEIVKMIEGFKSIYIITEYLFMHEELKKIYPYSVNTIRVAVVNQDAYNPKIMQAYMRIGSSSTGFTDNVGYGGICAKINLETGLCYDGEKIVDHKFIPCPVHPDTGEQIERIIPNWDYMCKGVIEICRFMPELEYLGFDIAITDDGFKIIEINIHQDLHKVADHSEEFKKFFQDKLRQKAKKYNLKNW